MTHTEMTGEEIQELGNDYGYRCPSCDSGHFLEIVSALWVALTPQGVDVGPHDTEWDNDSLARCECGWNGRVSDFVEI